MAEGTNAVIFGDDNGHIFRSTDLGLSWTDIGVISNPLLPMLFSSASLGNGVVLAGGRDSQVYRSSDSGLTWNSVGELFPPNFYYPTGIYSILSLGNGVALIGIDVTSDTIGMIYKSTDFGASWILTYNSNSYPIRADTLSNLGNGVVVFGNKGGHVFRSTDFGDTFVDLGVIAVGSINTTVFPGNGIVLFGDSTSTIYISYDYGATWVASLVITASILSSAYLENKTVIFGQVDGVVFISDPLSFENYTGYPISPEPITSIANITNGITIAGNFLKKISSGVILRSTDFGLSWTDIGVIPNSISRINTITSIPFTQTQTKKPTVLGNTSKRGVFINRPNSKGASFS